MKRINAARACTELLSGRRVGNRQWPGHRTLTAEDMHHVTPESLRAAAGEEAAEDWYVVPDPVTLTGDGSPADPFQIVG